MDVPAWLIEHGAAIAALLAALRAAAKARGLRDAAAAEAVSKLSGVLAQTETRLAVAEGSERGCRLRVALLETETKELRARATRAEGRAVALADEVGELRRIIRSDGR